MAFRFRGEMSAISTESDRRFHVFVYGTLQRGQRREDNWPSPPWRIEPAWVMGTLYGRHDYPALRPGHDRVIGECWTLPATAEMETLRTLDQIEGTNQSGQPNIYNRVRISIHAFPGDDANPTPDIIGVAWCYQYAVDPTVDGFRRIEPHVDHWVRWPDMMDAVT